MKKKIMITANDMCIGGIEKSLIELLKNINSNNYEVTLFLLNKKGPLLKDIPSYVNVMEYKVYKGNNVLIRKIKNFIQQLKFSIKYKNKFDMSICYLTYSNACNKISRISSKNRLFFVHSNYVLIYKNDEAKIREFFNDKHLSDMKQIIFVSEESMIEFLNYYPEHKAKSSVINNLVDYEKILSKSAEAVEIKKDISKTTFVFVGRLDESSKRITKQLEMIKYLNEQKHNVELWIVGDGPNKEKYENIIKENKLDNVYLLGQQDNPYPYLKQADYLLLTSFYEGFPVVFNEALVLGKQVITTVKVKDDIIDSEKMFHLIDVDHLNEEVAKIISEKQMKKIENIDFKKLNKDRLDKIMSFID